MNMLSNIRRVAVIAPHPDDEILGCGGTMARLSAAGVLVDVVIVTRGQSPEFDERLIESVTREAAAAHARLGVNKTHFLDLPAARLDQVPTREVNIAIGAVLDEIDPDTLLVPFIGDIHVDHQVSFNAAMVWARPRAPRALSRVWAYETLSETNWWAPGITPAFTPNCFIDISDFIDAKVASFSLFESQVKKFPDERSVEALRALAACRGASVYREAAEAFAVIRQVG